MANLTTYCRITGHSRNLPKPCYFPLLPPISPAESKKVCRITRYAGAHNYSPIIAFAKPVKFDSGVSACSITKFTGFGYFRPKPVKDLPDDANLLFYQKLLDSMKSRQKREVSPDTQFTYEIPNLKKVIVLPGELEEAIRIGEVESLGLSENNDHISIKVKEGGTIKIGMEEVKPVVLQEEKISKGEGPNEAVIKEQVKILKERQKKKLETMEKRKLFEDKDKQAEEEEVKSKERPVSKKPRVMTHPKKIEENVKTPEIVSSEEETEEEILIEDKAILAPKVKSNTAKMFDDVKTAQSIAVKIDVFETSESDISESSEDEIMEVKIEKVETELDSSSEEEIIKPIQIKTPIKKPPVIAKSVKVKKIDIVAAVETVKPAPKVKKNVVAGVTNLRKEKLKETQNTVDVIEKMDYNAIPNLSDIESLVSCSEDDMTYGYVVKLDTGTKFVSHEVEEEYIPPEENYVSGVMVPVENELKFFAGQIVNLAEQQSFVAGQTLETSDGLKFVPGLTVRGEVGEITFIPGTTVSNQLNTPTFVCGRIVEENDNEFVPGQYVNLGKENEIFTPGQTVAVDDGLKFLPGETVNDEEGDPEFVPGIKVVHRNEEKFVPGQVFSCEEGLKLTPGQIVRTTDGPSFVPGRSIETPENGNIFVKGNPIINDHGKLCFDNETSKLSAKGKQIIPNRNLHPVADATEETIGFNIKPTNTFDLEPGERLYGNIMETDNSVLFFMMGKLPEKIDPRAKIISGELRVGDVSQKFVPGRLITSQDGEKFVPGQIVINDNGEEFVPGKIVESKDGPKFIPGQVISTLEGDKFVPGQVLTDNQGPRFVPGQIIETEQGATFIPGQMMNTDEGRKFVPGQLIDTNEGPRFVPGQVVESKDGPKFLPGLIVETEDGLKYVPSEASDQEDDDIEFTFQGFDITAEELTLLSTNIDDSERHSPVTGEHGLIDSATLKKLSCDNMVVHGRTPDRKKSKKNKKKGTTVAFLSTKETEEKDELVDLNIEKVKVLRSLIASQSTVSNHKKNRELKKILNILGKVDIDDSDSVEALSISYMLCSDLKDLYIIRDFIGDDDLLIQNILESVGDVSNIIVNSQVQKLLKAVMKSIVTKRCNDEVENIIVQLNNNPERLYTDHTIQMLLAEAVGIVCITGDVDAASLLEQFISEPNDPSCLKNDKDIIEVLRQLLVLHEIAKRNSDVEKILHELRRDPANFKNKNEVFRLIHVAKLLLRKEATVSKSFNIRHIASSKDIPNEIFEQLKENKLEADKFIENLPDEIFYAILGDDRCGEQLLDSLNSSNMKRTMREIEKFKKGMAIVVAKENMQAVIPRTYARSVYYGIMPYILIDEEGIKFFERGLTGRKLAPSKVIENTWCDDDDYPSNNSQRYQLAPDENQQQFSVVLPEMGYSTGNPCLQYTSLLPSSGPTKLSYFESSRRPSKESSISSFRIHSRSTTPSRKSSLNSIYDNFSPLISESYSRKGSAAAASLSVAPTLATICNFEDVEDECGTNDCKAVVPFQCDSDEETSSVRRSDTVANLLDKYSNFSVEREFAKPVISSKKSKKKNRYKSNINNKHDKKEDNLLLPGSKGGSLANPEREITYFSNDRNNALENLKLKDFDQIENRRLRRPISDIFEADELESPTGDRSLNKYNPSKSSMKQEKLKKYTNINSEDEEESVRKYSLPLLSYSPRNRRARKEKESVNEFEPFAYSRRLSEPPSKLDPGKYSGNYALGKNKPSRSEERELLFCRDREYENGGSVSGNKKKNDYTRRYKHIEDPISAGYQSSYNPYKPYSSNYLDSYNVSDDDDDEEERPSYQLLGRRVKAPSRLKGTDWQPVNQFNYMMPRPYNTGPAFSRNPLINNSLTGRYEPQLPHLNPSPEIGISNRKSEDPTSSYGGYDNNILPNLNYSYESSPYLPIQNNYYPRVSNSYMERPSTLGNYVDPNVMNVLNKDHTGSYKNKYAPRTAINDRRSFTDNAIEPKNSFNESHAYDSEEDVRVKIPKFKKFDPSRYLADNDESDYDDEDNKNSYKADISRGSSTDIDDIYSSTGQRKLATDLAKKYLRSFSLDDKDEQDEDEYEDQVEEIS